MAPEKHDSNTVFRPSVWLSSVEHLRQFVKVHRDGSPLAKFLGRYSMPKEFPHVQWWLFPWMRVPIIYFANGSLTVSPAGMRFESRPRTLFGASVVNVPRDLCFDVARESIKTVEPFTLDPAEAPFPALSYFNFPWTRVRTSNSGIAADFLVGLGGAGPSMRGIRQRNQQLFQFLTECAAARSR
jgi:hypothetical protein